MSPSEVSAPQPGTSWQWRLMGAIDTSFDVAMYDVDLFDASDASLARLADQLAYKAAFHVEYVDEFADAPALAAQVCGVGPALDTLVKTWDLVAERLACP